MGIIAWVESQTNPDKILMRKFIELLEKSTDYQRKGIVVLLINGINRMSLVVQHISFTLKKISASQ